MFKKILLVPLCIFILYFAVGCSKSEIQAVDLMKDITPRSLSARAIDDPYIDANANFAMELFRRSYDKKDNTLVSPLSVLLALAMTANGANAETKRQMEQVLGGDLTIDELNEYLHSYVNSLPSEDNSKLNIANSIWFKDSYPAPKRTFLQTNADYYGASAYSAPFDSSTKDDINQWVNEKTAGMIKKIVEQIDPSTVMFLINAILFDAKWETSYGKEDVYNGIFKAYDGTEQTTKFMESLEISYLYGDDFTGFLKPYYNDNYSFLAILPDESISLDDFVDSLSPQKYSSIIASKTEQLVCAGLPKFEYEFSIKLKNVLMEMGIEDAFAMEKADFSNMYDSGVFISEVLHKTYISVDELGTKAGAVTSITVDTKSAPEYAYVTLNRPFVYAIIDNTSNLPIFIGTVVKF